MSLPFLCFPAVCVSVFIVFLHTLLVSVPVPCVPVQFHPVLCVFPAVCLYCARHPAEAASYCPALCLQLSMATPDMSVTPLQPGQFNPLSTVWAQPMEKTAVCLIAWRITAHQLSHCSSQNLICDF